MARGGGGPSVTRALVAARRSRTLLLLALVAGDTPAFRALGRARAGFAVLDHPAVGLWATRTALLRGEGKPVDLSFLDGVAAAAAVRAGQPVDLPAGQPVYLPTIGHGTTTGDGVVVDRPTPVLRAGDASFLLESWDVPGMTVDADPDVAAWSRSLAAAWEVLCRGHGDVAADFAALVSVLTPLPAPPSGTSSATVADALGCVLLSHDEDPESLAVSLAHELRHTKLTGLLDLVSLCDTVPGERFYAPWRDDPRPLLGFLHGTYAFAGVTEFWRRQRAHTPSTRADVEFARWRSNALAATETLLGSGRLTATGRRFVTEMAEELTRACAEPVPEAATRTATGLSTAHHRQWLAANQ